MNRITLDASHIILGQLNTVAIAWNFSKEIFYLYFKRLLVTQPSFQVVALAVPVGNLKPLVLIGYPRGQDRPILLPWDCPTNKARKF